MGRWVGAQMGLFSLTAGQATEGSVDVDYFRVSPVVK